MEDLFNEKQVKFAKWLYEKERDKNSPLYNIIPASKGYYALTDIVGGNKVVWEILINNFPNEIEDLNTQIKENYDIILTEYKKELDKQ